MILYEKDDVKIDITQVFVYSDTIQIMSYAFTGKCKFILKRLPDKPTFVVNWLSISIISLTQKLIVHHL